MSVATGPMSTDEMSLLILHFAFNDEAKSGLSATILHVHLAFISEAVISLKVL